MTTPATHETMSNAEWLAERETLQQRIAELEAQLIQTENSAEQQLRFTEALLAAIPTPVFFKDTQGRYIGCNNAFTEQMGVTAEEIQGKTVFELWPSEHAEVYHQKDLELLRQPQRQIYEFMLRDKNGQMRNVVYAKGVFYDTTGKPAGLVGAYVDISERKQAEDALRESEARHRAVFEGSPHGILIADRDTQAFLYANPSICRMLGYTEDALLQLSVPDIHPAEALPQVQQAFAAMARGEKTMTGALPFLRRDGSLFFAEVGAAQLHIDGRDCLVGFFTDVSDRLQAEEALVQQRMLLRTVIDHLPDAIYVKDLALRKLLANHADLQNMGLEDEAAALGKTDFDVFPPPIAAQFTRDDRAVLESGVPILDREERLMRPSGEERWLSTSKMPLRDVRGQIVGLIGIGHDITARKRAEDALRESQAMLNLVLDTIPQAVFWKDRDGYYLGCNKTFAQAVGLEDPADIIGKTDFDLPWSREEANAYRADDREVLERRRIKRHIIEPLSQADGTRLWIDTTKVPLLDETGQPFAVLGVYEDVTGRKQMEESLRKSEERNRAIVAALPDFLFQIDADNRFIDCHTSDPNTLLLPPEQVIGQRAEDILPPALVALTAEKVQQTLRTGEMQIYDYELEVHGEERYFETRMTVSGPQSVLALVRDITRNKKAEADLQESEARYRQLFDHAPAGIYEIDLLHNRILSVNEIAYRYLGYTREEFLQMEPLELLTPDSRDLFLERMRQYAEGATPAEQVECELVGKQGQHLWVLLTVRYKLKDGRPVSASVVVHDISERRQMEAALRQERDLSRALAEAAALINRTLDPNAVLDLLLEQISQIVPNDAANIMLIEAEGRVHVARQRRYRQFETAAAAPSPVYELDQVPTLRRMARTSEPLVIADTVADPDWVGSPEQAWLRSYVGAPICARGAPVGFLNLNSATPGFFTPLHAEILRIFADHAAVALENARLYDAARQELRAREQAEAALREREAFFHALFEQASDAIFIENTEDRILDANHRACELFGYSREELLQLTVPDLQAPEHRAIRGQAIKTELAKYHGLPFEGLHLTKDGRRIPVEITTTSLRIGAGDLALSIIRDITDRKAMETQLRRQEQLAAIGQLAAGIAHDFRNLLTTIILYAHLGQRRPDLPPTVAQHLQTIIGEAHKATDLIQQILDFGRRTELDRRPLDLVAFVENVVTVLQRTLPEHIAIMLDIAPGEHIIEGDAGRLQQALMNLALNARDAMPDGGTLCIGVKQLVIEPGGQPPLPEMAQAPTPSTWIHLSVSDTGMGMTEKVRAHLFQPFFTTKEEGKGTGLGLAQVYGIVQLHAGHIGVTTAIGQGTTFHIYLPATTIASEDESASKAATPLGRGETLLLVEDNPHLREAGESILTALGYHVLTAANGREALAIYQAEDAIALLITDLVMPELGGKALLQILREHTPNLKALVVTGYTTTEDTEALRSTGFLEIIRKPFDAETLAEAVRRALDT